MKKITSYLLLIALVIQFLGSMGVYLWFKSNESYISKVLCENRDKPKMHCNGQCILMKKLKALEEKSSEKNSTQNIKYESFVCMLQERTVMPENISIPVENEFAIPYKAFYSYIYLNNNFRPPQINA